MIRLRVWANQVLMGWFGHAAGQYFFEYDAAWINDAHAFAFAFAFALALNTLHDYYEQRMIGFAPIGSDVYCLVFVEGSEDVMRIISLRKATRQEVKNYVKHIN